MGAKRPKVELKRLLAEQRQALAVSCESFDSGNEWEAARLATTIFTLVHDGGSIVSLLTQLGIRGSLRFLSSNRVDHTPGRLGSPPLVGFLWQNGTTKFVPRFTLVKTTESHKTLQFQTWWAGEDVYKENEKGVLTRRRIVFALRHQDGGGHVGSLTDPTYVSFKAGGGWSGGFCGGPPQALDNGVAATMRQIAWEVTETLKDIGKV